MVETALTPRSKRRHPCNQYNEFKDVLGPSWIDDLLDNFPEANSVWGLRDVFDGVGVSHNR